MAGLPLDGVRVLEIGGGVPAAFATRWMAGFGAEVVRCEGPEGALTADEEVYLLPGKRRVRVDDEELRAMALCADIVVEDGAPGAIEERGLAPLDLREQRPELVIVSITPFGQQGPYAGWQATNIVEFAMGGIMSLTGAPGRPPLTNGGQSALYLGGLNAFAAALTAYYGALVQGEGDWIDLSIQECGAGMTELYGPRSEYTDEGVVARAGNHVRAVWAIYPVVDGFGGVCCLMRQVPAFFKLLGDPELMDERFMNPLLAAEHDDELTARIYPWFLEHTKAELLELGAKHKVPFGAVMTPRDLLASPGLVERGYFDAVRTPAGEARVPGRPFLGLPWRAGELHAEAADTAAVRAEWLGVRA